MKTAPELIEYIDHIIASLQFDYNQVYDTTRIIRDVVNETTRNRLDWDLAHMHKNLTLLINDFKRHQDDLKKGMDAGTTI